MGRRIDVRRTILEACDDLIGDSAGFVEDQTIAKVTGLELKTIRELLREMDEDRLVSLMRLEDRYKVTIEPGGRLHLFQNITRHIRRQVLSICVKFSEDPSSFFDDLSIASEARIRLKDVRVCLACMEQDGYVEMSLDSSGQETVIKYRITALGRLKNNLYLPFNDDNTSIFRESDKRLGVGNSMGSNRATVAAHRPGYRSEQESIARTILFLGANPTDAVRRRLDNEVKRIEQGLERAKKRDQFKLVQKWAVTDDDLRRALLDSEPEIVHFAGTAGGVDGLAFEDDSGQTQLISSDALARHFELHSKTVRCVILNTCYTEAQANAIARHIDYVVGMSKDIGEKAAVKFAVGFYDALGAGRDVEESFRFGCNAIDLNNLPEYLTPVLKKRS